MKKTDTFSVNSLKILDRSREEFVLKYEENLFLTPANDRAKTGQNLHSFLSYYLLNFDTSKIEASLNENDKNFIEKIKNYPEICALKEASDKNEKEDGKESEKAKIEAPFFVKCGSFYLTGRFDAVLCKDNEAKIFDWKTSNLPKDPEGDLQTIVYLYSAEKLYGLKSSITYVSLSSSEKTTVKFNPDKDYEQIILDVIKKY